MTRYERLTDLLSVSKSKHLDTFHREHSRQVADLGLYNHAALCLCLKMNSCLRGNDAQFILYSFILFLIQFLVSEKKYNNDKEAVNVPL